MNIRFSTENGVELAILPRAELERMLARLEDFSDIAAANDVMRNVGAAEDEFLPARFAERLIAGENSLRVWRAYRGLTQQALSDISAVNRVQIADIEAGRANGSVETLKKLADALGVLVDDLI
ncbi:MAG: helix-turn-helix transcriptional regulator [Alphaproteobacteria bacterium]|nr:helix-turn-helix transcriptional regulator [Alphaproteobacteria bacterium]